MFDRKLFGIERMGVCERVNEACSIKHFEGSSRVEKHYVRTSKFTIHYAGL